MKSRSTAVSGPFRASLVAAALLLSTVGVVSSPVEADTSPPEGQPATVSADGLPTWQINGVVWSQVTVGNVVYATGSFTKARPPGTSVGSSQEIAAKNIFAFDIRTGNRVPAFSHSLSAQGRVITASPDGSRVYVGGDFTQVDGQTRGHLAAFDTATGALVSSFKPSFNNQVRGITVGNGLVYVGGNYTSANGRARTRLAALDANGVLTDWAPRADDGVVRAMALSPDRSRLIVGGAFTKLNGAPAYGMGSLSTVNGQQLPWLANQTIRDATSTGAITSLRTDGTQIYGSGYAFGSGSKFEGTFAADPYTGAISWLNDCHGDTYDVVPVGQVLYSVGHAHDCRWIGSFPETSPRTWHRALASPTYPTGVNRGPDNYGWNFNGWPASLPLQWYPTVASGTYTGQSQGGWSITGNDSYVAMGGEFPTINGVRQQGLVRFAVAGLAPNRRGIEAPNLALQVTSPSKGRVRLTWASQWDMDNETLRYDVLRDGSTTPAQSLLQRSSFFSRPAMTTEDADVSRGTHRYQVVVRDPFGNVARSAVVSVEVR